MRGERSLALLFFAAVALAWFAPALFGGRLLFPLHSDLLHPWSDDLDPERRAEQEAAANPALSDKNVLHHPDTAYIAAAMKSGHFPLWNPAILGGASLLGQSLYGMLYPPNAVLLAVEPLETAYAWATALHVLLAGFGLYLFLRMRGFSCAASLVGGLLYAVSGPLAVRYVYHMTFFPVAWIPFLLCAVHRFAEQRTARRLLWIPFLVALVILSGFPQTGLYGVYLAAFYGAAALLGRLRWRGAGPLLALAASFAVGGLLSAAQLLPVRETFEQSMPRINDVDTQIHDAGSYWMPLGYLVPDAFQDPREEWSVDLLRNPLWSALYCKVVDGQPRLRARPNPTEASCYAGAAGLLLALAGALGGGGRRRWILLISLAAGWAYCLGFPPLVRAAYFLLPGASMGEVRRILPTLALLAAMLGALGVERLRDLGGAALRRALWLGAGLLGALLIGWFLLGAVGAERLADTLERWQQRRYGQSAPLGTEDREALHAFLGQRLLSASLWLAVGLAGVLAARRLVLAGRHRAAIAVVVAVAAADLGSYHLRYNPFLSADRFLAPHPLLEPLRGHRVHRYEPEGFDHPLKVVLPPNVATHFGIEDAMGYIVTVPLRYARYMERIEPEDAPVVRSVVPVAVFPLHNHRQTDPAWEPLHFGPASPLLDGASVRFLLTTRDLEQVFAEHGLPFDSFRLAVGSGPSRAYENLQALPPVSVLAEARFAAPVAPDSDAGAALHARILDELAEGGDLIQRRVYLEGERPRTEFLEAVGEEVLRVRGTPSRLRSVRRSFQRPEHLEVELEPGGEGGFLLVTDNFDPGWSARIDGVEVPILPANVAFRGLVLPPGARRVEMTYRPASLSRGLWISGASLFLWLLLCLAPWRRLRRNPAPPAPPPRD